MSKKINYDQNLTKNILSISNLFVIYNENSPKDYKMAVNNFSFDFKQGVNYCIIGQSGSGKSSLISCFNGLSKPQYGIVKIVDNELKSKRNLINVILAKKLIANNNGNFIYILYVAKDAKYSDVYNRIKSISNQNFNLKKGINKSYINDKEEKYSNFNLYTISIADELKEIIDINIQNYNSKFSSILDKKYKKKIKNYHNIRKSVGMVYQFPEYQLFKSTILSDASFGARNLKIPKQEAIDRSKNCLLKLEIPETKFNDSPFELSGGQKRRVALAGIFAIDPLIYIFDEPTAGLDPVGEQDMIRYMLDLKGANKTLIFITHSMDQVLSIADEVLVIHDGKLVKHGNPYEIFFDQHILDTTNINEPLVINIIKKLIKKNNKFKILLEMQPKNVYELSECLIKILKDKKRC